MIAPALTNSNFHPKSNVIEVGVFPPMGHGPWSTVNSILARVLSWRHDPWDLVSNDWLSNNAPTIAQDVAGKSEKTLPGDPVLPGSTLACRSATDLGCGTGTYDLVITDPPFGGLVFYAELSDFFYVWLRLVLKDRYPEHFSAEYTPKTLEAISNRARRPDDADAYYQRLLTESWREARRILKPGGLLAFTFHHSEDAPWISVLESLFEAGFYLQATYPIQSDETKGEGQFGARKIEFDIIHVCRKRADNPPAVSWAKMRRQILVDIASLRGLLEQHQLAGLPEADLEIMRRGKALEFFSKHYGKVFVDGGRTLSVRDALLGIHQILEEEANGIAAPPPVTAEPLTRQFLRLFDSTGVIHRDHMQKFLRGTGVSPSDFVDRGWCREEKKAYRIASPQQCAREWNEAKPSRGPAVDYDQAMILIGICFEGSGINLSEILDEGKIDPHPALLPLLEWFFSHGATPEVRQASSHAHFILRRFLAARELKGQSNLQVFE
jgi:SAM-dependent methyltransferase